jgi:adenosine kinase
MRVIVSGSIAFDYLMHFPGRFREHILPDNLNHLSVSFLVDRMRRAYGGCGANIAYNLALLGERPLLVGAAGCDFAEYRQRLESHGVDTSHVLLVPDEFTASFFVSTDEAGSQIASFYIGAMAHADRISLHEVGVQEGDFVIVSPNKPEAMLRHAAEAKELRARLIFDPSQQIPRLSANALLEAVRGAYALTVNEYEYELLKRKTGLTDRALRELVPVFILTRAEQGSLICAEGEELHIPPAAPAEVVDPTGVGDAYRAGLIKGLLCGLDWQSCGKLGSLAACYALEALGTQEHWFSLGQFLERYELVFGERISLAGEKARPSGPQEPSQIGQIQEQEQT